MSDRRPLPRTIRGGRPVFFADPAVDKVISMMLNLASEVWALRERLAAVEAIGRARGVILADEVDRHEFAATDAARLEGQRRDFIDGLLRALKVETPAASAPGRREPVSAAARVKHAGKVRQRR